MALILRKYAFTSMLGAKYKFRKLFSASNEMCNTNMMPCWRNNRLISLTGRRTERTAYIRAVSTQPTRRLPGFSAEGVEEFMDYFPEIVRDLTEDEKYSDILEVMKRFATVLEYCVPTGRGTRNITMAIAYKTLEKPENLTAENIRLAHILGWCSELLASSIIVYDDITDNSVTRRNAPCWFRVPGVGLNALFDASALEHSAYAILKKYFSSHPFYVQMMELFHDASLKIALGQTLDSLRPPIEQMTMNRYNTVVKYKTCYSVFSLPILLAMYLSKAYSTELHRQVEPLLMDLALYFQIRNDFWDCFVDPAITGKIGTDIQEGACTWLLAVALQKANPAQRKILAQHYERPEEGSVAIVRHLYEELGIPAAYATYEEESFNRLCANIQALSTQPKSTLPAFSTEDEEEFMNYFPEIVRHLTEDEKYSDIDEAIKRFTTVVEYCVPTGKRLRGLTTVIAYKLLEKPENLTKENIKLANILGWCVELLGAAILVYDDIVDNSITRRNVPCWFRVPGVGLNAVLDANTLEHSIYAILKKYFSSGPFYVQIMEIFHDTSLKVALGQTLDSQRPRIEKMTMDRFNTISKYKTGYYTFYMPVVLGMYLSKIYSAELHRQVKLVLFDMGRYFQIKNDYLDCFGDPSLTGKIGTDIQEGKCTWLLAFALQKANTAQRKNLTQHYGRPDGGSVAIVRHLFEELRIPAAYVTYEEDSFNRLCVNIQQVLDKPTRNLLTVLIEKLYKRKCISVNDLS